jgi:hypothetical protein
MRVGMRDKHGRGLARGKAAMPGVAQRDVARGEEASKIGERATGRDQAGKLPRRKAQRFTNRRNHRVFDRGGPGPHFKNGHRLVGDRTGQLDERGQRHGRWHLVADVVRVMKILAACE